MDEINLRKENPPPSTLLRREVDCFALLHLYLLLSLLFTEKDLSNNSPSSPPKIIFDGVSE